jgi:hypothetical protein
LDTNVERRAFDGFRNGNTLVASKVGYKTPLGISGGGAFGGQPGSNAVIVQGGTPVAPVATVNQSPTPSQTSGGGKAAVPRNPGYPGSLVSRDVYSDSASEVLFGVSTGASVILDLNAERTFFVELWGKYQWVQDFALDNGLGRSTVDLSSFQAGLGVGYRF